MPFIEDFKPYFGDFGVAVDWQPSDASPPQVAQALFDAPGQSTLGGQLIAIDYTITYHVSELVGLENGEAITVDGKPFVVREVTPQDDGQLTQATLGIA